MDSNVAAEHLQVIRTLMERSAVYRRALAPIMLFAGLLGASAAVLGRWLRISDPTAFVAYWYAVALVGLSGAILMVRRQAWQQSEPFWSPPTRRVAQAALPPLTAGCVAGILTLLATRQFGGAGGLVVPGLPLAWIILYGCALHAAGFFTTRGMRLFGWLFIGSGFCAFVLGMQAGKPFSDECLLNAGHGLMGLFFGAFHLAYGIYLRFTEPRGNES